MLNLIFYEKTYLLYFNLYQLLTLKTNVNEFKFFIMIYGLNFSDFLIVNLKK